MFGLPLSSEGRSGVAILHVDLTPRLAAPDDCRRVNPPNVTRMINSRIDRRECWFLKLEALSSQLTTMLMDVTVETLTKGWGEHIVHPPLRNVSWKSLASWRKARPTSKLPAHSPDHPHRQAPRLCDLTAVKRQELHRSSPPCVHDFEEAMRVKWRRRFLSVAMPTPRRRTCTGPPKPVSQPNA